MIKFAQSNTKTMTKESLGKNPWEDVAKMLHSNEKDCFYRENKAPYVCPEDEEMILYFNKKVGKDDDDFIITQTPPEPWKGNPLNAKLIVLSLNPGYLPEINETLAKLIQSNDVIRKELIEFRKRTLCLDEDSFFPPNTKTDPISIKDAEDILQGWYWSKRFKTLITDIELDETEFYKKVALIEYHGYSSKASTKGFPYETLPSQKFTIQLIKHIATKNDVCFLIMRSIGKWEKLLNSENNLWDEMKKQGKLIYRNNPGRSQYITNENLKDCNCGNGYEKIKEALKG